MPEAKVIKTTELQTSEAKWVTLEVIDWEDEDGKRRRWEVATRKTRGSSGVDAVDIFAVIRSRKEGEPLSTIIIEQYRPPAGRYMIEWPAGLIDDGEDANKAALRELEEETGFPPSSAKILETSPLQFSDPGMTTANQQTVTLEITVDSLSESLPEQKLDAGEHIVRRVIPIDDINDILHDYEKKGFAIDAKLTHFAIGWEMAKRLRK